LGGEVERGRTRLVREGTRERSEGVAGAGGGRGRGRRERMTGAGVMGRGECVGQAGNTRRGGVLRDGEGGSEERRQQEAWAGGGGGRGGRGHEGLWMPSLRS
jgi:hypothetical protein